MQLKAIITIGLLSALGILFTGCGTTKACLVNYEYKTKAVNAPIIYVSGKEAWRSPSAGYNIGTRNTHILQNAATITLEKKYKYFAFHKPNGISNTNGGLINTAEEFVKNCVPTAANPFEIGQGRCGWLGRGATEEALIVLFNKKPYDMLVYDAKSVLTYLKANKLFREDGIEEYPTGICNITSKNLQ